LRPVVFFAVDFFAVVLRAVVFFAAAGATLCPLASLGFGTLLDPTVTPPLHAFPPSTSLCSRVSRMRTSNSATMSAMRSSYGSSRSRCRATRTRTSRMLVTTTAAMRAARA
jgi:hypothetical protein